MIVFSSPLSLFSVPCSAHCGGCAGSPSRGILRLGHGVAALLPPPLGRGATALLQPPPAWRHARVSGQREGGDADRHGNGNGATRVGGLGAAGRYPRSAAQAPQLFRYNKGASAQQRPARRR